MKRPLWSILTAAVAAVLPGMTGPTVVDAVAAPVPEASAKPAPEAVQVRRPEIRRKERFIERRRLDDRDENPAPVLEVSATGERSLPRPLTVASIEAIPEAPDVAPRARRSLGRPRVRAPDHRAV